MSTARAERLACAPLAGCVVREWVGAAPLAALVLLHGHGETAQEWMHIARALAARPGALRHVRYVLPEAPLALGTSRAWWKLDRAQLSSLRAGGAEGSRDFYRHESLGMQQSRAAVSRCIDALCAETGLTPARVAIAGFSQGAILAVDVALHLPEPPFALAVFSGAMMQEHEWSQGARRCGGVPVLVTHGSADPVLPVHAGERLAAFLSEHALDVSFERFDGGHALPPDVSDRLAVFLESLL